MAGDTWGFEPPVASSGGGGGGGSGLTLADLIYDPVAFGSSWVKFDGDYTYGGQYQCMRAITFVGAKVRTLATSGTLTAKLWSGGVVVASGSATITAAGTYTITFTVPYDAALGELVTIGARDTVTLTYFVDANVMTTPFLMGGALRMIAQSLRNSGDLEPNLGGGQGHVYGLTPILSE